MTADTRDRLRQVLVLLLTLAQPVTTFLAFALGTSFEEATRSDAGAPLLEPAGYAFSVWTLIYGSCLGYGIYQALPSQRNNLLSRRTGFPAASAFAGTCAWLLFARFNLTWGTVACILWMLASLAVAFRRVVALAPPRNAAERWLVVMPISVFTGWVSAAVFANTAAALKVSGWHDLALPEAAWAVVMLLAAGTAGAWLTVASRGNAYYALTVVWALVAIAVANLAGRSPAVAVAAAAMASLVLAALVFSRRPPPEPASAFLSNS